VEPKKINANREINPQELATEARAYFAQNRGGLELLDIHTPQQLIDVVLKISKNKSKAHLHI
jgi:hypothetical protein